MRGSVRDSRSRSAAFILFSLRGRTRLEGNEWKGYASRTGRLDIPVRTSYLLLSSDISREFRDLRVSIIAYGPPYPPIHILLSKEFFSREKFEDERELMRYFIRRVFGKAGRGEGWAREHKGLLEVVRDYASMGYSPVLVREGGERPSMMPSKPLFILGTDYDLPESMARWLGGSRTIGLGSTSYLTSHVALSILYFLVYGYNGLCSWAFNI